MSGAEIPIMLALSTIATTGTQLYMADEAQDQANKLAGQEKLAQAQAEEKLKEEEKRTQDEFIMKAQRAQREGQKRPAFMNMFSRPEIGYTQGRKQLVGQ